MPEGFEKYFKKRKILSEGINQYNPDYSSPRYEEEKNFPLIFPDKPDTGIKDIITATRNKNFNEEKMLQDARRKQVPIDSITQGIVKNAVAPIGEAFDTISKGAENIGLGFNKAGATGDYSQLGEGGIELLQGLLHTAFTPFTVPYGGITGGLRGSGEVGSEIATGLDRTMQLPFDAVNKGSELTQQGLNTLGYNPQNAPGLETKADELLRELAGLVLLKKAHTGAKDLTQEKTPLDIASELLNENRKAPEKNIKETAPIKTPTKTKEVKQTVTNRKTELLNALDKRTKSGLEILDGKPKSNVGKLNPKEESLLNEFDKYTEKPEVNKKYEQGSKDAEIVDDFLVKQTVDGLKKQVEDSGLIYDGIQKTGGKGDYVTWTDPKTKSTHLTPVKDFAIEKVIADRDKFRKDWEVKPVEKKQVKKIKPIESKSTPTPKVEKQAYESKDGKIFKDEPDYYLEGKSDNTPIIANEILENFKDKLQKKEPFKGKYKGFDVEIKPEFPSKKDTKWELTADGEGIYFRTTKEITELTKPQPESTVKQNRLTNLEAEKQKLVDKEKSQGYLLNKENADLNYLNRAIENEINKKPKKQPKKKAVKEVIEQPKVVETKTEEKTTGIKNAVVNKERVERGLEPLQTEGKRTWGKVWDEAKQKIESKEVDPRKLADDLTKEARPITDTEAAILDFDRVTLNNQHRKILDDIAKTPDDVNLKTELLKVEDALNNNDIAARLTGTEAGRSLAIRRMMLKDDYSIASLVQQARTANNGKTVSPEVRAKLEDLSKRIEDADKKFLEYEERISKLEAEKIIKKVQRDMKLAERKEKRQFKKQDIDAEFEDLVKQFAKTQSLNVAFTSEQIALLGKLTKNRVKAGVNSIEGIVDELYSIAKDKIDGITKRDIMDAISGYGKFTELTKDEINIKLRDIRRQGRLLSAIEDLQNKVEPLKTGFEREKLSKRSAELTKTLNQLRKQEGELSIDPNVPLKSYKTRLENSIKEYERKLREKDFTKPERNKLELDAEAKRLVDLRDRLKNKAKDEIFKIEQGNRTTGEKVKDWLVEISNVPRTMMASVDLSAPLRQGVVPAFSHPITTFGKGGAFRKMFEYAKSEEGFKQLSKEIEDSPYNQLYRDSKLDVIDIEGKNISKREEAFISNLPEKIPVYGKLVRGSNRAYTGFLFKLRKDLFDKSVEQFEKAGLTFKTDPEIFKGMASWINNATGRGNFRSKLGQHALNTTAPIATSLFFSPRLIVSRMQLLNPAYYLKLPKEVRKLAMKDMAKFIGVGTSILGLAKLAGADIETDSKSSDFMKIKVGNTRQDIWGGLQQYVVLASRLATNESTSLSGQTRELSANSFPFTTRKDLIYRFGENKLSPAFGFMRDFLRGTNWEGEEFSLSEEALQLIVPLYINETIQSIQEEGLTGGLLSTPGLFGVGVSTYKNKKTDEMQSISNKEFQVSELKKKALETRNNTDTKAFREAQTELETMRDTSSAYQNDLQLKLEDKYQKEFKLGEITKIQLENKIKTSRINRKKHNKGKQSKINISGY